MAHSPSKYHRQCTARSESGSGENFWERNAQPRVSEHTGLMRFAARRFLGRRTRRQKSSRPESCCGKKDNPRESSAPSVARRSMAAHHPGASEAGIPPAPRCHRRRQKPPPTLVISSGAIARRAIAEAERSTLPPRTNLRSSVQGILTCDSVSLRGVVAFRSCFSQSARAAAP
jgi:hypothetical protein